MQTRHVAPPRELADVRLHGPSVSIGGRGSSAILHRRELNEVIAAARHEEAWMVQVYGQKLWLVGFDHPELREPCRQRPASLKRCVLSKGDVMYLPDSWAHATCGQSGFSVGLGFIGSVRPLPLLHRAAVLGQAAPITAEVLRPAGANMLDAAGLLPSHWAAWNGHLRALQLLEAEWQLAGETQARQNPFLNGETPH